MVAMKKIVILGPAHPLRGGLASFNERLCREFNSMGFEGSIYTFSLQYPSFLFPGTTQYSAEPAPADLNISVTLNSVNPLSWLQTGYALKKLAPDIIVVRYWLPFMGPALGTVLRIAKRNRRTKVVCIADNVLPHEKRPGDVMFTKYFVKPVDAFITMSKKVLSDLRKFTDKPAAVVDHPLYDNFGAAVPKRAARLHLGLPADDKIILFFGFIRHYKGLDLLIQAMGSEEIKQSAIKLLVAGEFYEDRAAYDELIKSCDANNIILKTDFVSDSEVKYYLSAADFVIQPYRSATQSGVTPLAYHFEKPMLVTNVGALPDLVPHEKVGIVTEPNPQSISAGILQLYNLGEEHFIPHIQSEKVKYSWKQLVETITEMANRTAN